MKGDANPFYEHMTQVQPGDVVFAFADTRIQAVAIVNGAYYAKDCPEDFKATGNTWRNDGWAVPVDYHLVDAPLKVSDHMGKIESLLPTK